MRQVGSLRRLYFDSSPSGADFHLPAAGDADNDGHDEDDAEDSSNYEGRQGHGDPATGADSTLHHSHLDDCSQKGY